MTWNGINTKWMNRSMAGMFENEKIENGLKSFFLDLEKGEQFSYVQLVKVFVQQVQDSHSCLSLLYTWISFLFCCICLLYKSISCTIGSAFLTFAFVICTVAPISCTIGSNSCMVGA